MTLTSGARLGPYEIQAAVGSGGMGDVYKARDTRLNRFVALKVLGSAFQHDAAGRERFEREARAVAALEHPHICVLHDVGHHEGVEYLVMQFLEGETLASRLSSKRERLPLDQALRIATQIAAALDAAHRRGIVHRDLKPANVMLTKAGVKLLDFGLAKQSFGGRNFSGAALGASKGPSDEGTVPPTTSAPLTVEGTILGTLQYMSPEQIEGQEADARSDIFAFGCVLYEMVTGQRAFEGQSPGSVIAAVLGQDPPAVTDLQPLVPAALSDLIRACMAKDPDQRWQSTADLERALVWFAGNRARVPISLEKRRIPVVRALASALILTIVGVIAGRWLAPAPSDPHPVVLSVVPPKGTTLDSRAAGSIELALSPDGRALAFVASSSDGERRLFVRALDSAEARLVAGSEGADHPFWSPPADHPTAPIQPRQARRLPQLPCPIGDDARVGSAAAYEDPTLSPDETRVVAQRWDTPARRSIWIIDSQRGTETRFTTNPDDMAPVWSPDGSQVVYASARDTPPNLFVKSISEAARAEDRLFSSRFVNIPTSWSRDGQVLVYGSFEPDTGHDIFAFSFRTRTSTPLVKTPFDERNGRMSPDGRWVVYTSDETGRNEVYARALDKPGRPSRISTSGGEFPAWRSDGRELFYLEGGRKLMSVAVDIAGKFSAGMPAPLFETRFGPSEKSPYAVSADGRRLLVNLIVDESEASPITVVVNWQALVSRK